MKKLLLLLLLSILSFSCYCQIAFEKGYYIDNNDQKIDCFIKNIDWRRNPNEFEYKLKEDGESKRQTIKSVKEFGINNFSKYERATVNIDRSSNNTNKLSDEKNPIFNKEELFLKVLVEGQANLYEFIDGEVRRFFYSVKKNDIEQLIYKRYKAEGNSIGKNNTYRQQLISDLKCSTITLNKINNLDFEKGQLVKFFVEFNECSSDDYINYAETQKKNLFNLNLRPGLNNSKLSLENILYDDQVIDFGNKLTFRFGIEAEFILPFNKNKWAIIIEPSYQYYISEKELQNRSVRTDYQSVEIPIGIRYYVFLNKDSKVFFNSSLISDISYNSIIKYSTGATLEIKTTNNFAFGVGYKCNDKYSLELRYQTSRDIVEHPFWISYYKTVSVIIGYTLF